MAAADTVSTSPSVRSCRNSRPRVAPKAVRTAYSRDARVCARHQQIRQVRARDQEHEPDRRLQHDQRQLDAADDVVAQRIHADAVAWQIRHVPLRHDRAPLLEQPVDVGERLRRASRRP